MQSRPEIRRAKARAICLDPIQKRSQQLLQGLKSLVIAFAIMLCVSFVWLANLAKAQEAPDFEAQCAQEQQGIPDQAAISACVGERRKAFNDAKKAEAKKKRDEAAAKRTEQASKAEADRVAAESRGGQEGAQGSAKGTDVLGMIQSLGQAGLAAAQSAQSLSQGNQRVSKGCPTDPQTGQKVSESDCTGGKLDIAKGIFEALGALGALATAGGMGGNAGEAGGNQGGLGNLNLDPIDFSPPDLDIPEFDVPDLPGSGTTVGDIPRIDPSVLTEGELGNVLDEFEKQTGVDRNDALEAFQTGDFDELSEQLGVTTDELFEGINDATGNLTNASPTEASSAIADQLAGGFGAGSLGELKANAGIDPNATIEDFAAGLASSGSSGRSIAGSLPDLKLPDLDLKSALGGNKKLNAKKPEEKSNKDGIDFSKLSKNVRAVANKRGLNNKSLFQMVRLKINQFEPMILGVGLGKKNKTVSKFEIL